MLFLLELHIPNLLEPLFPIKNYTLHLRKISIQSVQNKIIQFFQGQGGVFTLNELRDFSVLEDNNIRIPSKFLFSDLFTYPGYPNENLRQNREKRLEAGNPSTPTSQSWEV